MDEEDVLCRFGTPLEPLVEDEIPSKKPILIEDQIVTDENGRRRFHGAFTGGFSAGFWNTVGSLEGWTPKDFKSSRDEKGKVPEQKPADFMDDEDFGEFGIAPQRVQTTADFTSKKDSKKDDNRKRKQTEKTDGPIPGVPVLHQLLEPSKDNVAIRLLKRMGWKEGQGIGARQTKKEKNSNAKQNSREQYVLKKYGCDMGPMTKNEAKEDEVGSDESDLSDIEDITFAPDDFEPYICVAKDNCFGLGYSGLSRDPVLKQHINLFGPLEVFDNNKQKLSIRGKGFGVGALEEEDEDIYHHDDFSNYDFSLDKPSNQSKKPKPKPQDFHIIEGFSSISESNVHTKKVFFVQLAANFTPRNWLIRKSRFEPLDEKRAEILKKQEEIKIKGLGRHDITSEERGIILEGRTKPANEIIKEDVKEEKGKRKLNYLEKINQKYKTENQKDKVLSMLALKSDNFVKSEVIKEDGTISKEEEISVVTEDVLKENEKIKNEASKLTKNLDSTKPSTFKPFLGDSAKQERYEKFINENLTSDEEIMNFLRTIQPPNMSDWERQMEKKEFQQARRIYKPLKGIMSDRFVTEAKVTAEREEKKVDPDRKGKTIRTKSIWHPVSILCKRFNIAEPFVNIIKEDNSVKKPKLSVFDYLEDSVNRKDTFVTPVIIPKIEEIQKVDMEKSESPKRLSAKDMFSKEIEINKNIVPLHETESNQVNEILKIEKLNDTASIGQSTKTKNDRKVSKDKPKSEIEKKIEEFKNKHPSEKKDLYKTVFETSSDSEEDIVKCNTNIATTQEKAEKEVNSKDLLAVLNKPAGEVNILRNNSPPRGIFAAFFKDSAPKSDGFSIESTELSENVLQKSESNQTTEVKTTLEKVTFRSQKERSSAPDNGNGSETNVYGPRIPNNVINASSFEIAQASKNDIQPESEITEKLQKLLGKHKHKTKKDDEWVEITSESIKNKDNKKDKKKKKKKDKSKNRNKSSSSDISSNSSNDSHRHKKKSKKSKKSKKYKK